MSSFEGYDEDFLDQNGDTDIFDDEETENTTFQNIEDENIDEKYWNVSIEYSEIKGDGMSQHTVYRVIVKKIVNEVEVERSLLRRYNDFAWLRKKLVSNYRGYIVPPLPEKGVVKKEDPKFLKNRKKELVKFLSRVLNHQTLSKASEVETFLLDDDRFRSTKLSLDKNESTSRSERFINSLSSYVSGKPQEIDSWYEQQKAYINQIESQYKVLLNKFIVIVNGTKDQSFSFKGLSDIAKELSILEDTNNPRVSHYFKKLSECTLKVSENEKLIKETFISTLEDSLRDFIRYFEAVNESFNIRDSDLSNYQSSTKSKESKQEKLHKNPSDPKLIKEVNDAEEKELKCANQYKTTTKTLREELANFYKLKQHEFQESFIELLKRCEEHHRKSSLYWKEILDAIQGV